MLRCSQYGYTNAQYSRHGTNKYGYSGRGSAAMSDTEYDNMSDDDDDDEWMVESAVPPAPEKFRSQVVYDRRLPAHERNSSVPAGPPPNRQRTTQPVQAALKIHGSNSLDNESVCSGVFKIDLSTIQNIQNQQQYQQQARVVSQSEQFTGIRKDRRPRPYSSASVNDPEPPVPYGRDTEYRVPYAHPHSRHAASERHQQSSSSGRPQFHDRMTDDPRSYQAHSRYNFAEETGRCEPFQNYRDYGGYERNQYGYEPTSYNTVPAGFRYHVQHDSNSYHGYGYPTETDLPYAREDGNRRLPRFADDFPDGGRRDERSQLARDPARQPPRFSSGFPDGGRGDERNQSARYVDDPGCRVPRFTNNAFPDAREDERSQSARYIDDPARQQPRFSNDFPDGGRDDERNQPARYVDDPARRPPRFPDGGRGEERSQLARNIDDQAVYRSSVSGQRSSRSYYEDRYEDRRPKTRDRNDYVPTRDVPPPQMTGMMSSPSRSQTSSYHVTRPGRVEQNQPRYDYDDRNQRYLPSVPANDFEPISRQEPSDRWKQTRVQDKRTSRSSSASRHETEFHAPTPVYVQSRQNTARDTGGIAAEFQTSGFPASNPESQSYRKSAGRRSETWQGNSSSSISMKAPPESFSGSRSSSRDRYPAYQDEPDYPHDVPGEYRSSDYQDGRRMTGRKEEQDTRIIRDSRRSENKAVSSVYEKRHEEKRHEEKSRRVKFQSDSDLSNKEDSGFHASRLSSKRSGEVTSDTGRASSGRRYQSSESLQGSSSQSRDLATKEDSGFHASCLSSKRSGVTSDTGRTSSGRKYQSSESLQGSSSQSRDLASKQDSGFHVSRVSSKAGPIIYSSGVTSDSGRAFDRIYQSSESLQGFSSQSRGQDKREYSERQYSSQTSLDAQTRSAATERIKEIHQRTRSVDRVDRADRAKLYLKERAKSRGSSKERRRNLPRVLIDDEETSSVIRDVTSEIARMTSSVNSIDSETTDRQQADVVSSVDPGSNSSISNVSQSVTNSTSRLTMSTNDLDSCGSIQNGLGIHKRLEEQKKKKTELRRKEVTSGGSNDALLAQIQDDLQSEITRCAAELDAAEKPTSHSVALCDQQMSSADAVNIVNTALLDSQVKTSL